MEYYPVIKGNELLLTYNNLGGRQGHYVSEKKTKLKKLHTA